MIELSMASKRENGNTPPPGPVTVPTSDPASDVELDP